MAVDPREEHAEAKKRIDESLLQVGRVQKELSELVDAFRVTGDDGMRDKCLKLSETLKRASREMSHTLVLIDRADLAVQTERQNHGITKT